MPDLQDRVPRPHIRLLRAVKDEGTRRQVGVGRSCAHHGCKLKSIVDIGVEEDVYLVIK